MCSIATNSPFDRVEDVLKKSDEKDEVDVVAFGLETDDGEIVKVYVNVTDADEFEKAMAEMLGKEDDVEEAIKELAREFDVVDVVWPEDKPEDNEGTEETVDAAPSEEGDLELDLETEEDVKDVKENRSTLKASMTEALEAKDQEVFEASMEVVLSEPYKSMTKSLTTPLQLRILQLFDLAGIPADALTARRTDFLMGVRQVARKANENSSFKMALRRLLAVMQGVNPKDEGGDQVDEAKDDPTFDVDRIDDVKAFKALLANTYARMAVDVFIVLGLPIDKIIKTSKVKDLRDSIKDFGARVRSNGRLRSYFKLLAASMDLDGKSVVKEEVEEEAGEGREEIGSDDPYVKAVVNFAKFMGIPAENLQYRESHLVMSLKKRKMDIGGWQTLCAKLEKFIVARQGRETGATGVKEEVDLLMGFLDK